MVVSSAYLELLIFLPEILIPACDSSSPAFLLMYSAYKLNKQGDNIYPWHTPFPIWNQSVVQCVVLTSVSWPAYMFLRRELRWSSIPISFKNFPQFVVVHTVKGFKVINEAEVDVYLEFSCFFYDPTNVGNLIPGSSAFSKTHLSIWKFSVHILLKPSLKNFEHYLTSMWNEYNFEHSLTLSFFRMEWKLTISIPVATAEFFKFGAYWVQHLTTSSFRIWNSSAGIPSPALALFMGMLSKAHLTSNSKMSGSSWVITLLWLSGSFRAFVYSSSVYSYHFLISSASIKSMPFLYFIVFIFAWNVPFVSLIFLKRSLVCPFYCFLLFIWIDCLMRAFLSLLAVLWNSTFRWEYLFLSPLPLASLLFSAICKASTDCHFAFLNFFFLQIDGETVETVADFIFLGSKNHCRWWLQPWN